MILEVKANGEWIEITGPLGVIRLTIEQVSTLEWYNFSLALDEAITVARNNRNSQTRICNQIAQLETEIAELKKKLE